MEHAARACLRKLLRALTNCSLCGPLFDAKFIPSGHARGVHARGRKSTSTSINSARTLGDTSKTRKGCCACQFLRLPRVKWDMHGNFAEQAGCPTIPELNALPVPILCSFTTTNTHTQCSVANGSTLVRRKLRALMSYSSTI